MKKMLVVMAVLFLASYVFAGIDVSDQEQLDYMSQNGLYSIGISNGPIFRFVSKNWSGYEIPLSISYSSGNSGDVMNDSVSTGYSIVMPIKIIGGLHVNFIPGITGGYAKTFSETSNTEYNDVAKANQTVNLKDSSYTITAGAVVKLEVEYLIGRVVSFLPGDISIGGNVAFTAAENYSESYTQVYDEYEVVGKHTCFFGTNASLALNGTTLSSLVIRYYF
jgi:hypothetical protein